LERIIELGLNRRQKTDPSDPEIKIVWLIDQLLDVLVENLSDDGTNTAQFRSRLEALRREILQSNGVIVPNPTAIGTLGLCREQFKQYQAKYIRRDENFAEIIVLLRTALSNLTGESKQFTDNLLDTSSRIKELVDVNDIQELKARITSEVNDLNRAVSEKQQRDQVQFEQLSEQVSTLQQKLKAAKTEALIDGLTGIANRRNFDMMIQRWVIVHSKNEEPFTVALFDLDNFKEINDSRGHLIGDQVLIAAASELSRNIRSSDYLARYGGEEFVVLSDGMKLAESERRFSNLLKKIEATQFECKSADKKTLSVTMTASCGVAEYALGESSEDLIRRADEALYEAKREGKNRVCIKRRSLLSAYYEGRKKKT